MTSVMTSTVTSEGDSDDLAVIIGVSVAGVVLLVIAVILLVFLVCRVCRRRAAQSYLTQTANYAWGSDDAVNVTDVSRRPGLTFSLPRLRLGE